MEEDYEYEDDEDDDDDIDIINVWEYILYYICGLYKLLRELRD